MLKAMSIMYLKGDENHFSNKPIIFIEKLWEYWIDNSPIESEVAQLLID